MKFKKKDIDKLINILQSKKEELKQYSDDILFEISNGNTIIYPVYNKWCLDTTRDPHQQKIIFDWMQTQIKGNHWDLDFSSTWYLHVGGDHNPEGYSFISKEYKLITFEEFEKYIINK